MSQLDDYNLFCDFMYSLFMHILEDESTYSKVDKLGRWDQIYLSKYW